MGLTSQYMYYLQKIFLDTKLTEVKVDVWYEELLIHNTKQLSPQAVSMSPSTVRMP
jgi:hypothetical protein